ncbi:DUF2332 family protein [Micropruina sp.]|uniref:DUF2332 family protein n=1 Tax=Micropruina sp. TaxID=2737536 RepID=UPI0039E6BE03
MDDETSAADVRDRYRLFAELEGDLRSPRYADWARGVAADAELPVRLGSLPPVKQQPNLVLAAFRACGVPLAPWPTIRDLVIERWDPILATIRRRSTQTNEARRLATLLPAFAALPQPLALIEVGASMGLCLQPGRWSYNYNGLTVGDPTGPRLSADLDGPLPAAPQVAWSAGLDLNPLSADNPADVAWLEALIWPVGDGEVDTARVRRLHEAVALSREFGPTVRRGDLLEDTWALIDEARERAATVVVFHTAVLAYLKQDHRDLFAERMRNSDAHWISNEGLRVLPRVRDRLALSGIQPAATDFLIALDEQPFALADAHGSWVRLLR